MNFINGITSLSSKKDVVMFAIRYNGDRLLHKRIAFAAYVIDDYLFFRKSFHDYDLCMTYHETPELLCQYIDEILGCYNDFSFYD